MTTKSYFTKYKECFEQFFLKKSKGNFECNVWRRPKGPEPKCDFCYFLMHRLDWEKGKMKGDGSSAKDSKWK
mgnify:CR=1 FL=1